MAQNTKSFLSDWIIMSECQDHFRLIKKYYDLQLPDYFDLAFESPLIIHLDNWKYFFIHTFPHKIILESATLSCIDTRYLEHQNMLI